jgi:hypothetical protein
MLSSQWTCALAGPANKSIYLANQLDLLQYYPYSRPLRSTTVPTSRGQDNWHMVAITWNLPEINRERDSEQHFIYRRMYANSMTLYFPRVTIAASQLPPLHRKRTKLVPLDEMSTCYIHTHTHAHMNTRTHTHARTHTTTQHWQRNHSHGNRGSNSNIQRVENTDKLNGVVSHA